VVLEKILSRILSGYISFCFSSSTWQTNGQEQLLSALDNGPIILVLWHSRLAHAPSAWPSDVAQVNTLNDPSPIGRVTSGAYERLGMRTVRIAKANSDFATARTILKVIRDGNSLGLVADGPLGPARVANRAPIEWARSSGLPIFFFAWSARRSWRLKTWDHLLFPLPYARGKLAFKKWPVEVPKKLNKRGLAKLRRHLSNDLSKFTDETDQASSKPVEK